MYLQPVALRPLREEFDPHAQARTQVASALTRSEYSRMNTEGHLRRLRGPNPDPQTLVRDPRSPPAHPVTAEVGVHGGLGRLGRANRSTSAAAGRTRCHPEVYAHRALTVPLVERWRTLPLRVFDNVGRFLPSAGANVGPCGQLRDEFDPHAQGVVHGRASASLETSSLSCAAHCCGPPRRDHSRSARVSPIRA